MVLLQLLLSHLLIRQQPPKRRKPVMELKQAHKVNLLDHLKRQKQHPIHQPIEMFQMKEIRGLGDRLSGLEQLLLEAKRLVQEQQKLAAAFVQNQQRASGLRDVSILPDLCASHRQQLLVMQKNHQQIISICNRSGSNIKYFFFITN